VWVGRRLSGLVLVIGAIGLGLVWLVGVVVQVLSGVLSWHGLVYSFGLAEAGDLVRPAAVRAITLIVLMEVIVMVAWLADYYGNRGPRRALHGWLWAHVSGPARDQRSCENWR
jgi:hypothetical protein